MKRKKYGHIISLGYNCEVSFQFFLKYHFVESSLFAWVNAVDCQHMIYALKNLSVLTTKGFKHVPPMYEDIATGISFHPKENHGETEKEEKAELKSRILHLKEKFIKTASDGKKNLYIFKCPPIESSEKEAYKDIVELYNTLKTMVSNEFDLLIILEEKMYPNLVFDIPNIYVRRVNFFTPYYAVTSKPYDKKHFNKIFSEFCPNFKLPKTKHFKFEDTNNKSEKIMHKRQKYDLIFSMGAACSCSSSLRSAELQVASYPFDWLFGSDFCGRADIIANDFKRFIDKKDLEFAFSVRSIRCDAYHNKYNDLTFNHDFEKGKDLSETYDAISEKYSRRINRLLSTIQNANKTLIVYIETPDCIKHASNSEIKKAFEKIQKHFKFKDIDLVYFVNNNKKTVMQEIMISNHITKFEGNYKSKNIDAVSYDVDKRLLKKFLIKRYKLKQPFAKILRRFLIKTVIKIIPSHKIRVNMRKKFHLK